MPDPAKPWLSDPVVEEKPWLSDAVVKPYNPRVEPGKYPISTGESGVFPFIEEGLNWGAQKIAEPVGETLVEPIMGIAGAAGRLNRSLLAGKGLSKAWDNAMPETLGGTPHEAPSGEQLGDQYSIPKLAEDAPGFYEKDTPGLLWDSKAGDVNWWNVVTKKVPRELRNLAIDIVTDPISWVSPGASPEAKAIAAAKIDALSLRNIGAEAAAAERLAKVGETLPAKFGGEGVTADAAARAWQNPLPSELAAKGQFGLNIHPPHLPIPFAPKIPGNYFLAIPKSWSKALKPLDVLSKNVPLPEFLDKTGKYLKNPNPADPLEIMDRMASEPNMARVRPLVIKTIIEPATELERSGVTDPKVKRGLAGLVEQFVERGDDIIDPARAAEPEHIPRGESATYTDANGQVFRGKIHADAMERAGVDLKSVKPGDDTGNGFMTSRGRVVSRDEAAALQNKWKEWKGEGKGDLETMSSEDIDQRPYAFRPANAKEAEIAQKLGLSVQSGYTFGSDVNRIIQREAKNRPGLAKEIKAAAAEGPAVAWKQGRNQAALEEIAAMDPKRQAAALAYLMKMAEAPKIWREFTEASGVPLPPLNAEIISRPSQIAQALDKIEQRPANLDAIYGKQAQMGGKKPLPEAPYEAELPPGEYPPWYRRKETKADIYGGPTADIEPRLNEMNTWGPRDLNFIGKTTEYRRGALGTGVEGPPRSAKLDALAETIQKRRLTHPEMNDLIDELSKTDAPQTELTVFKKALLDELPQAVKEHNAVPMYRPGALSEASAAKATADLNPNMRTAGVANDLKHERASVWDEESGIPGVKKPVSVMNEERRFGSSKTFGMPVNEATQQGFVDKYLKPEGWKKLAREAEEAAGDATPFEPDLSEAWTKKAQGTYQDIRQKDLDTYAQRMWQTVSEDAVEAVRRKASGGSFPTPLNFEATPPPKPEFVEGMSVGDFERLTSDWEKAVKQAERKAPAPPSRPATLEELQKVFKEAGGDGPVENLLSPDALKELQAGKISTKEAFGTATFHPYAMDKMPLAADAFRNVGRERPDAHNVYVHKNVAQTMKEFKALGTDPQRLNSFMRFAAPALKYFSTEWRKNATFRGPQFFAYQTRNLIGDLSRMDMGRMLDFGSAMDMGKMFKPMYEYARTGDKRVFAGLKFNMGPQYGIMDGVKAAELWEYNGVLGKGEISGDILGTKLPESTTMVDNSYAGMAKRNIPGAKPVVEAGEKVLDSMQFMSQARENATRAAAFNTALRQGDSALGSAIRVDQTLFNFSKVSPGVNMLRQTGLVPFAAWHSKAVPFVVKWALQHPGEFVATLRALDAVKQKEIDESQLPEWMRSKHNMITKVAKMPNGKMGLHVVTSSGLLPILDVAEYAAGIDKLANNDIGGLGVFADKAGPFFKMAFDAGKMMAEQDNVKTTVGEKMGVLAEDLIGRPASSVRSLMKIGTENPRTGEVTTAADAAFNLISPLHSNVVDVGTTGMINKKVAEKAKDGAQYAAGRAQFELDAAQKRYEEANGDLNTAGLMTKDVRQLQPYIEKLNRAREALDRARAEQQKVNAAVNKSRKFIDQFNRVP